MSRMTKPLRTALGISQFLPCSFRLHCWRFCWLAFAVVQLAAAARNRPLPRRHPRRKALSA